MNRLRLPLFARVVIVVAFLFIAPRPAVAQSWNFDARNIGLGGVGDTDNLASTMIPSRRPYGSIVLPFGLLQVFSNLDVFDPDSKQFDPIRSVELAANPIHYVVGRDSGNSAEALFVGDIRNATLSRDLSRYRGFVPASTFLGEGLAAPHFGYMIPIHKGDGGGTYQSIYVGAGPYFSMHADGNIDPALIGVWASGVNVPNANFLISNANEGQVAFAITGGYRARVPLNAGGGAAAGRDGLYFAVNYNYLRGLQYENIGIDLRLQTDSAGLLTINPSSAPLVIKRREGSDGQGFAVDAGVGVAIGRWDFGAGINGIGNRITWTGMTETTYTLPSLITGNSDFIESPSVSLPDAEVSLPVNYRANVAYTADQWTAVAEGGHGFGGASFHGGLERRLGRVEVRGGAHYGLSSWNPTGGVGMDLTPHFSVDVAAFGTTANIEKKRQLALAVSLRFNAGR